MNKRILLQPGQPKDLSKSGLGFNPEIITKIISSLFVLLFVYAAANKLMDYDKFKVQLGQSPLLTPFASYIAWLIPAIEIIISLLLLVPRTIKIGMLASFALMVMFTAYIIAILNFSSFIPCSCGGILEKMGWGEHLAFNLFFVVLAIIGIIIGDMSKRR